MKISITLRSIAIAAVVLTVGVAGGTPLSAFAQSPSPPASLSPTTVKALQEALNKQGIAVKTDGVLDAATREAVRKYQSQHHLPVTGEPDKATLDKLGVAVQPGAAAPGGGGMMMQPGQGGMMGQGMMPPGQHMMGSGAMGGGSMPQGQGMTGQGMGPGPGMGQGMPSAPTMPKQ